jgi:DNA-binding transcriptional ArsR family regulator
VSYRPSDDITDPRIVRALGHPLRAQILLELDQGIASPSVLAAKLDEPLGTVSYHVRILADLGLLRLVKTTPRRGAVEHHYSAEPRRKLDDQAWREIPSSAKRALAGGAAGKVASALTDAAGAGAFERSGSELSATPLELDGKGWRDAAKEIAAVTKRLKKIEAESAARLQEKPGDPVTATAVVAFFAQPAAAERPAGATGKDSARRRRPAAAGRASGGS